MASVLNQNPSYKVCERLLRKGDGNPSYLTTKFPHFDANAPARNTSGWPLLHYAAHQGHLHVVRGLLQCGASLLDTEPLDGSTPLYRACRGGEQAASVVAFLLAQPEGVESVNVSDAYGKTPLHAAAGYGNETIVRMLLEAGADVSVHSAAGDTAAERARRRGHLDVAALLEETA